MTIGNIVRSILFNLLFYSFTVVYCLLILPLCLLPGEGPVRKGIHGFCLGSVWLARHIMGITFEYRFPERMPKEGALVIAAAHQSYMDPMLAFFLRHDVTALAKKELFQLPLIGQLLRKMNVIRVYRGTGKAHRGMQDVAKKINEKGQPLIVYPQATRVAIGHHRELKAGAYFIQEQGEIPVYPIATSTGACWTRGFWHRSGTVIFEVCEPIEAGLSKAEFMTRLEHDVVERSHELIIETGFGHLLGAKNSD